MGVGEMGVPRAGCSLALRQCLLSPAPFLTFAQGHQGQGSGRVLANALAPCLSFSRPNPHTQEHRKETLV